MKYLVLCFSILIYQGIYGQEKILDKWYDSLRQYSYLIAGLETTTGQFKGHGLGTGFFVRMPGNILFFTAKHIVTGYSTTTKLRGTPYDTLGIRYYDTAKKQFFFYQIMALPPHHSLTPFPNDYFWIKADIAQFTLIDTFIAPYIYSIEKYITDDKMESEKLDSALSIGYALEKRTYEVDSINPLYYKYIVADNLQDNNVLPKNDSLYYILKPTSRGGMSGSPVFSLYRSKNEKTPHILFGGILIAGDSVRNKSFAIPAQYLREYFFNKK